MFSLDELNLSLRYFKSIPLHDQSRGMDKCELEGNTMSWVKIYDSTGLYLGLGFNCDATGYQREPRTEEI